MEYKNPGSIPNFAECQETVSELGFKLVELQIVPQRGNVHITAVIASKDSSKDIGVSDCGKVHRALLAKLIALLEKDEDSVYMEVCSPGLERNIKNAWEFTVFTGRSVRVWDRNIGDWTCGKIVSSDEEKVTLETQEEGKKSFFFSDIAKAKFYNL